MQLSFEITKELKELVRFRWVVFSTVSTNLKVRYKRSILGFFWSLLGPVVSYGTVALVFYYGMRLTIDNYFSYFFPAVIFYSFMSMSLSQGAASFLVNETYIKKVYLPKTIFVTNVLATELFTFFLNLSSIIFLGLLLGKLSIGLKFLYIPFALFPAIMFIAGLGFILSTAVVFLRDLNHIVPLLLQAMFYMTPIVYSIDSMPKYLRILILLNPFTYFVDNFRYCFIDQDLPPQTVIVCWTLGVVTFLIGSIVVKMNENKIIFKL